MRTSESTVNISKAIAKAQAEAPGIQKSGNNTFDKYKYANLEDYIDGVKPILAANGLSMMFSCESVQSLDVRTTKNGGSEYVARLMLSARLTHESGEWVEIAVPGEGQDRGDKGVYKAMTGARKYAVACLLGLATTDDPENDGKPESTERSGVRPTEQKAAKPKDAREEAKAAFVKNVKAWTKLKNEDILGACSTIIKKVKGKEAKDATADDLAELTMWVAAAVVEKIDFMQWSVQ